jgi:hypothetical protein
MDAAPTEKETNMPKEQNKHQDTKTLMEQSLEHDRKSRLFHSGEGQKDTKKPSRATSMLELQREHMHEETKALDKAGNSKLDPGSNLQPVADQINADFDTYKEHEKEATKSMLKIGLMLEYAMEQLPHGQLMKWVERNLTLSYKHATRFRQLAKVFIKANQLNEGEAFALVDPANSQAALADRLQQMAFDFLGDKTQGELLEEHGIRFREPKKIGGFHPGPGRAAKLQPGETLGHYDAIAHLAELLKALDHLCLGQTRTCIHMHKGELKAVEDQLVSALHVVRDLIKAG